MRRTCGAERKRTFNRVPEKRRKRTLERNTENVFREGRKERGRQTWSLHSAAALLPGTAAVARYITDKPFHATFTILFYFERYIFLDFIAPREREIGRQTDRQRERERERPSDRCVVNSFLFNDFHRDIEIYVIMS